MAQLDPDDEALYRDLQRQQRLNKRLTYLAIAVLGLSPFALIAFHYYRAWQEAEADRLTPAQVEETRRLLARLSEEGTACEAAWQKLATRESLAQLQPGTQPCSTSLATPTPGAAQSYVRHASIDGNYFGDWSLRTVRPGEPIGEGGHCVDSSQLALVSAQLDRGEGTQATLASTARQLATHSGGSRVILLVSSESRAISAGKSFIPGRVRGRAYLYDVEARRFVCAGDVDATNSENVESAFTYMADNFLDEEIKGAQSARGALARDLEVNLRRAVANGLRAPALE